MENGGFLYRGIEGAGITSTVRELYTGLLGRKDVPLSPDQMPDTIFVPPEIGTQFARAYSLTLSDDIERFVAGRVMGSELKFTDASGGSDSVMPDMGNTKERLASLIGRPREDLIRFHTHPSRDFVRAYKEAGSVNDLGLFLPKDLLDDVYLNGFRHSRDDISSVVAQPSGLMDCVVHAGGVSLVANTEMVKCPRNPVLAKVKGNRDFRCIKDGVKTATEDVVDWLKAVVLLEDRGFAYYYWRPGGQGIQSTLASQPQDIQDLYDFAQSYDIGQDKLQLRVAKPEDLAQGITMRRLSVTPLLRRKFNI